MIVEWVVRPADVTTHMPIYVLERKVHQTTSEARDAVRLAQWRDDAATQP